MTRVDIGSGGLPSADRSDLLSQYNNMLVRNIEFFYPASSHLDYDNMSGSMNSTLMSQNRLGLRCIHCKNSPTHVCASSFFPRTIGSLASGLGTVGTRHCGWGKGKSLKVLIALSLRSKTHNTFLSRNIQSEFCNLKHTIDYPQRETVRQWSWRKS